MERLTSSSGAHAARLMRDLRIVGADGMGQQSRRIRWCHAKLTLPWEHEFNPGPGPGRAEGA